MKTYTVQYMTQDGEFEYLVKMSPSQASTLRKTLRRFQNEGRIYDYEVSQVDAPLISFQALLKEIVR